jgi:hypothetical protein
VNTTNNQTPALIRTWTPILVGALISFLTARGIDLDDSTSTALFLTMTALIQGVYYTVVRLIEVKAPQFGWLLGLAKAPAYSKEDPPAPAPAVVDEVPEAENVGGLGDRYRA